MSEKVIQRSSRVRRAVIFENISLLDTLDEAASVDHLRRTERSHREAILHDLRLEGIDPRSGDFLESDWEITHVTGDGDPYDAYRKSIVWRPRD